MRYSLEYLPNGFVRVDDRCTGLGGLFNRDGSVRHGELTPHQFKEAVAELEALRRRWSEV